MLPLAQTGLFRASWSDEIHDEWMRNVSQKCNIPINNLTRSRQLVDTAVPDCVVDDYQSLIASLSLPDPNDRHVLAAAIKAKASAIVMFNAFGKHGSTHALD